MRFTFLASLLVVSCALRAQQANTVSTTVSVIQPAAAAIATFQVQFVDASLNSSLDTAVGV